MDKTYYISLTLGLDGNYVKVQAPTEEAVAAHTKKYYGSIWQSIYTEAYFYERIRRRYPNTTRVLNNRNPVVINDEGERMA